MSAGEANLELLRAAISRKAGIVLSLPAHEADGKDGKVLKHYKSRFLADGGDGLWVAAVPAEAALVRELVERRGPAGVSFRSGHTKVVFAAPVLHVQSDYPAADGAGTIDALLLRFPDAHEVRAVQRRKTYRVPVPANSDLTVRLWRMSEQAHLRDKPPAKSELRCDLFDISVAGLGVVVHGHGGKPPAVAAGDRVRVQLTMREATVLLEGRLRYPPKGSKDGRGPARAGIQFKTLTDGKDDRNAMIQLDRMVSELQRESIRRRKLGVA